MEADGLVEECAPDATVAGGFGHGEAAEFGCGQEQARRLIPRDAVGERCDHLARRQHHRRADECACGVLGDQNGGHAVEQPVQVACRQCGFDVMERGVQVAGEPGVDEGAELPGVQYLVGLQVGAEGLKQFVDPRALAGRRRTDPRVRGPGPRAQGQMRDALLGYGARAGAPPVLLLHQHPPVVRMPYGPTVRESGGSSAYAPPRDGNTRERPRRALPRPPAFHAEPAPAAVTRRGRRATWRARTGERRTQPPAPSSRSSSDLTAARSAAGGTFSATMPKRPIPSPVTPNGANALSTWTSGFTPSVTMSRIVHLSERLSAPCEPAVRRWHRRPFPRCRRARSPARRTAGWPGARGPGRPGRPTDPRSALARPADPAPTAADRRRPPPRLRHLLPQRGPGRALPSRLPCDGYFACTRPRNSRARSTISARCVSSPQWPASGSTWNSASGRSRRYARPAASGM